MYSGHRREGDVHHLFGELLDQHNCFLVFILDVDLIHKKSHNITLHNTMQKLRRLVLNDRIIGLCGGNPCESWCAARYLEGGPRPLRSKAHPYCGRHLGKREYEQVSTGNALLLAFLELQWLCYCKNIPSVREHPAPFEDKPSTWTLDIEIAFYRLEGTQRKLHRQGSHGHGE